MKVEKEIVVTIKLDNVERQRILKALIFFENHLIEPKDEQSLLTVQQLIIALS